MNIPMNLPKKALLLVALCAVILIGAFYFYSTNPQTLSAAESAATFQGKQVDLIVDSSQIPDTYLAKGPSLKLPTALKTSITKVSSSSKGVVTSEKLAAATQLCPSQWDEDGKCYKYVASNVAAATNTDCSKLSGIAKSTCLLKANAKQAVKLTCNQDVAVPVDQETKECGEKPQTQSTKTPSNQSAPANGSFKSGNPQITCPNKYNGKITAYIGDDLCYVGLLFTPNRAGQLPVTTRNLLSGNLYIDPDFDYLSRERCLELFSNLINSGHYPTFAEDQNAVNQLNDCLNNGQSNRLNLQNPDGSLCLYAPLQGQVTSPCEIDFTQQCKPTKVDGVCKTGFMARDYGISISVADDTKIYDSVSYPAGLQRQYCPGLIVNNLKTGRANTHVTVDRRLNANIVEYKTAEQVRGVIDDGLGFYVIDCQITVSRAQNGGTCVYAPASSSCDSNIVRPNVNEDAQADLTLLDGVAASAGQNVALDVNSNSDSATTSLIRNGLIGRTNSPVIGVISNARDRLSAGIQGGIVQGANDGAAIPINKVVVYDGQVEDICPSKIVQDKCYVAYLSNASGIPFSPAEFEQMQTTLNLNYTSSFNSTFDVATLQKCKSIILDDIAHGIRTTPAKLAECMLNKTRRIAGRDPYCLYAPGKTSACSSLAQNAVNQESSQNPVGLLGSLVVSPIKVTKVNTFGFTKNVEVKWSTQPKANYTLVLKNLIGGLALTKLQSAAMTLDNAIKLSARPGSYNLSIFACAGNKNCKLAYVYFKVAANGAVSAINAAPVVANGELSSVIITSTQLPKEGQHFAVNVTWITNVNANATLTVTRLTDDSNVPVAAPVGYNKGRSVKVPIHENLVPANFKATITSCTAANVCITNETQFNVDSNGAVSVNECDPLIMAQCPPLNDEQNYDLIINSYIWAVNGLKLTLTNPNTDSITITEVSVGDDPGQNFIPVEIQPDEQKVVYWPNGCGISGYQVGGQYNEDLAIKYDTFLGPEDKYAVMQGICSDILNPDQEGNEVNGANAELAFNATLTGLQVTQNTLDLTWEATLPNSHNLTLYEIDSNARLNQIQAGDLNGVRVINIASPFVVDGVLMLDGNSPFRLNVPGLKPNTLYLGFMTLCAAPNLGLQCVDLDIQAFTRDASQAQFESDVCPIRKVNGKCTASVQISKAGVAQANRVELYPRDAALRKFIQLTMDNTLDQECLEQAFALSYGGFDELNILYSIRGFAVPFQVENDIYKLVNANIADGICNLRLDRNADGSYCLGYPATAALCDPNVNDVGGFPVLQGPDFNDPVPDVPVNNQDVPAAANGDSGDRGSSARIRNGNNNYLLFPCEQTHLCPPEQTTPVYDDGSSNGGFVDSTPQPVQQPVQKPVAKPAVKEPTKDKPTVEESNFVDSQAVLIAALITLVLLLGGLFFAFKRK